MTHLDRDHRPGCRAASQRFDPCACARRSRLQTALWLLVQPAIQTTALPSQTSGSLSAKHSHLAWPTPPRAEMQTILCIASRNPQPVSLFERTPRRHGIGRSLLPRWQHEGQTTRIPHPNLDSGQEAPTAPLSFRQCAHQTSAILRQERSPRRRHVHVAKQSTVRILAIESLQRRLQQ